MTDYPFVVWQIVGYKNSGKTTLMTLLVNALQQEGLRVGTVKHHGHGGKPEPHDEGTDSARHFEAGAVVSGVEGDGVFQWSVRQSSWSLHDLLHLYSSLDLDVVLVEGYKEAEYPKWVLLREEEEQELLQNVRNVKGVVQFGEQSLVSTPSVVREDQETSISTIVQQIKEELDGR